MTIKEKLLELMEEWANESINVTSWEDNFLESYTYCNIDDILDFTPKQEEVIERMYSRYILAEGDYIE